MEEPAQASVLRELYTLSPNRDLLEAFRASQDGNISKELLARNNGDDDDASGPLKKARSFLLALLSPNDDSQQQPQDEPVIKALLAKCLPSSSNAKLLFLGEIILAWTAMSNNKPAVAQLYDKLGKQVIPSILEHVPTAALDTRHARALREWIGVILLGH